MTKKERLESLLMEIPCLYQDYKSNEVFRYSPFGKYKADKEELADAYSIIGKSKLLCIIEQDMVMSGEKLSLINYVIDESGFTPKKQDRINPAIFSCNAREIYTDDYKQTAYVFESYCYNATWKQIDHGTIGIVPFENTIIRLW